MHLANGDIPVSRSVLSEGEAGIDETVDKMVDMAKGEYGARSAKVRALAINILNKARVENKDYYGMIVALGEWVRDNIRYVRDPIGQETLSYPEETAFNSHAGDCLAEGTRVLTPKGYENIEDVKPGDTIQGKNGWTNVLNWWDKGALNTREYALDNGGCFIATDDHRCFLLEGGEKRAGELRVRDALLGPSEIILPSVVNDQWTDADFYFFGLYIADGWCDGKKTCIAGKDGFAKEAQKHWCQDYAAAKGWRTHWHARYLTIYIPADHPLYEMCHDGRLAPEKELPPELLAGLTKARAQRLLDGLFADSYDPCTSKRTISAELGRKKRRGKGGVCHSTTSPVLAAQVRLLLRMLGFSMRSSLIVDHGGFGLHPVFRNYPRYYKNKPAKIESIRPVGLRHVYDIQTADSGIYLPDADVVVHNCDDQVILVMGLLGSIGLKSYPVCIGMVPNSYSHVYAYAEVPPGKHRNAGQTIAVDTIMREWPIGKEAPDGKVKAKKTYSNLAGDAMLGAYALSPSYLDEKQSADVPRALKRGVVDAGGYGEIFTTPKVDQEASDIDSIFTQNPIEEMAPATGETLYNLGPMTAAGNAGENVIMPTGRRYSSSGIGTVTKIKGKKFVDVPSEMPYERGKPAKAKSTAPTSDEMAGLSDMLASLGAEISASNCSMWQGVNGPADPVHRAAAAAAYARQRYRKAKQVVTSFMPGLGRDPVTDARANAAAQIAMLAQRIAAMARQLADKAAGSSPMRRAALIDDLNNLERLDKMGFIAAVDAVPVPATTPMAVPVTKTLALANEITRPFVASPVKIRSAVLNPLPAGAVVRDRTGRKIDVDEMAGLGSWASDAWDSVSSGARGIVNRVSEAAQQAVRRAAQEARDAGLMAKAKIAEAARAVKSLPAGVSQAGYESWQAAIKAKSLAAGAAQAARVAAADAARTAAATVKAAPSAIAQGARGFAAGGKQLVSAVGSGARQAVSATGAGIKSAAGATGEAVKTAVSATGSGLRSAASAVGTATSQAGNFGRQAVSSTGGALRDAGSSFSGALKNAYNQAGATLRNVPSSAAEFIDENRDLLMAAGGGALIASIYAGTRGAMETAMGIVARHQKAEDEGAGAETYLDADGNPITKEQYDALMSQQGKLDINGNPMGTPYTDAEGNPITAEQYKALMDQYAAQAGAVPPEQQYLDADGNPITKEQYDALMAQYAAASQEQQYTDAYGNPISKEQYDALVSQAQAQQGQAPVAPDYTGGAAAGGGYDAGSSFPEFDSGSGDASSSFDDGSYGGGEMPGGDFESGGGSSDFGPDQMGPAVTADSATAYDSGEAAEGALYASEGGGNQSEFYADEGGGESELYLEEGGEGVTAEGEPLMEEGQEIVTEDMSVAEEGESPELVVSTPRRRRTRSTDVEGDSEVAAPGKGMYRMDGLGALPSFNTLLPLAAVGLGVYLLARKKRK